MFAHEDMHSLHDVQLLQKLRTARRGVQRLSMIEILVEKNSVSTTRDLPVIDPPAYPSGTQQFFPLRPRGRGVNVSGPLLCR